VRLDLSYSKQIDDTVVKAVAVNLRGLRKLCLRFLNLLTAESILCVLEHLKQLEGLDISGCFAISLDGIMTRFRDNTKLRCLLLEYLFVNPYHLYHLKSTRLQTLSLFCKSLSI
jgi:hypothetical protein